MRKQGSWEVTGRLCFFFAGARGWWVPTGEQGWGAKCVSPQPAEQRKNHQSGFLVAGRNEPRLAYPSMSMGILGHVSMWACMHQRRHEDMGTRTWAYGHGRVHMGVYAWAGGHGSVGMAPWVSGLARAC